MSHVNAEKAIAGVTSAGTAKMMDSAMGKMDMDPMMMGGMGSMMGGMGPMMKEGMGPMMGAMGPMMKEGMGPMMGGMGSMMKNPGVATGVATGAVASASASAGKSVITKIFTHPLVIFGLGVAAGYYLYKYRKSIISASDQAQQEE